MNYSGNRTMVGSAVLFALFLLVSTGCTKEEVVAPNTPTPMMQTKAGKVDGNGTVGTGTSGNNAISPISDDGDDLGDSERSNRPKN
ncbi:MAG: hypothetical protein K8H89_14865 [Flavobacteriales bacterium]|nr:hypothetical protein [Flavobacteriales bacterium]MCB0759536.1 hypothetical protein [Flavobacteriales bacterium]